MVPAGLLQTLRGEEAVSSDDGVDAEARKRIELLAMEKVMETERRLGREPEDVSARTGEGLGCDILSRGSDSGPLFIEVKGRAKGGPNVTLATSEIRRALNSPERFRLAIVQVSADVAEEPIYVKDYDFGQPGFNQTNATFSMSSLLQHGTAPE